VRILTLKSNKKRIRHKWILAGVLVIMICGLGVGLYRFIELSRLPEDSVTLPAFDIDERIEIPPRPGIQGIIISGPVIKPLKFEIDPSKSGLMIPISWRDLRTIDPYTDVVVDCRIDSQGKLSILNVWDEGHTRAGNLIKTALRTWRYTNYKRGHIRFWFNLPSRGKKLVIDTQDMFRSPGIPEHIPIYQGKIHLIEGIRPVDIQQ
jgi:hypothetical protein